VKAQIAIAKTWGEEWILHQRILTGNISQAQKKVRKSSKRDQQAAEYSVSGHYYKNMAKIPRDVRIEILKPFVEQGLGTVADILVKCATYKVKGLVHDIVIGQFNLKYKSWAGMTEVSGGNWADIVRQVPLLAQSIHLDPWYSAMTAVNKSDEFTRASVVARIESEVSAVLRSIFDGDFQRNSGRNAVIPVVKFYHSQILISTTIYKNYGQKRKIITFHSIFPVCLS